MAVVVTKIDSPELAKIHSKHFKTTIGSIVVDFQGENPVISNSYTLKPTKRKGFYEIRTGNWVAIVSKNTQKIDNSGDEETAKIEAKVTRIRDKAFA
jgi:hypothetical protein